MFFEKIKVLYGVRHCYKFSRAVANSALKLAKEYNFLGVLTIIFYQRHRQCFEFFNAVARSAEYFVTMLRQR
jgi:hypothetical protein